VKVKNGTELSKNFSGTFSGMTELINKAVQLLNEIASASKEQATGLAQIADSVSHQDQLVQQNAAEAASSQETATDLSRQVLILDNMIAELRILVRGGMAPAAANGLEIAPANALIGGAGSQRNNRPVRGLAGERHSSDRNRIPYGRGEITAAAPRPG
jgi:methyl-accepting chemotaxis protein